MAHSVDGSWSIIKEIVCNLNAFAVGQLSGKKIKTPMRRQKANDLQEKQNKKEERNLRKINVDCFKGSRTQDDHRSSKNCRKLCVCVWESVCGSVFKRVYVAVCLQLKKLGV